MLVRHPGLAAIPLVEAWAQEGRPVIVRRLLEGEPADGVPAALALPPSLGKRRVAMSFASSEGLTFVPGVRLREARIRAPDAWQPTIEAIVTTGERLETPPGLFGALLWEHLTGLSYLSPVSDLDLLWAPADPARLAALVADLATLDAAAPFRIDGEIILPDGAAVNWRELCDPGATEVLVKTMQGVTMRRRKDLFPA